MRDVNSISKPGSVVGIRVNLDAETSDDEIMNESKHKAHSTTIQNLVDSGMKVVVLTHHSTDEPKDGKEIMRLHTTKLRESVDASEIRKSETHNLSQITDNIAESEVIVYPNLSDVRDGMTNYSTVKESKESPLARRIASNIDAYVNDAFSISHRNYPTITGVPFLVPSYAGNVMKSEFDMLQVFKKRDPTFVFGGTKIDERIDMIERILSSGCAEQIILGGLLSSVFLLSKGYELGEQTRLDIQEYSQAESVQDKASNILTKYGEDIYLPEDIAIEDNGKRKEFDVGASPYPSRIKDLGSNTVREYKNAIQSSDGVIGIGPVGMAESDPFEYGTREVYNQISNTEPSAIYGETTASICEDLGITGFYHTSRGDEAVCKYLCSSKKLPGISVLLPEDSITTQKFGILTI